MHFTIIDLIILVALVFAVSSGYRRGFWLSLAQYAGLVIGVIVGAALAPVLMDALNISDSTVKSLGAVLVLIVLGAVGSSVGYWVGEPIRLRLLAHPESGRVDSFAGAVFSALALLSVSWFLGLRLKGGPPHPGGERHPAIRHPADPGFRVSQTAGLPGAGRGDHCRGQLSGCLCRAGAGRPVAAAASRFGQYRRHPGRGLRNLEDPGPRLRWHRLRQWFPGRPRPRADQRPRRGRNPRDDGHQSDRAQSRGPRRTLRPRTRRCHPLRATAGADPPHRGIGTPGHAGSGDRLPGWRR